MIARIAGVALDARVAARTRDPRQRALAAQWIAANVLGASGVRSEPRVPSPPPACIVSMRATTLRAVLSTLASTPFLVHPATLPVHWRAALRALGIPLLDRSIEAALARGASVALVTA
jgi:hypothetical protein